jgi:hypothetical protein
MSAWSLGAKVVERPSATFPSPPPAPLEEGAGPAGAEDPVPAPAVPAPAAPKAAPGNIDVLVTWIPGEVIAFYSTVVLALQPEKKDGASPPLDITGLGWLVLGIALASLLTFLAAWSKTDDLTKPQEKELGARVALAAAAFTIWSFVVPGSWWYSIEWVAEHSTVVPIVAGIIGLVFGFVAEGTVLRVKKKAAAGGAA